ncbi:hypothetical protein IG631_14512 [Alternaria alternata]|nr:hypothetical protein IG631_14512 [Alternaria alternata]
MSLLASMPMVVYQSMSPGIPRSYRSRAKHVLMVFSGFYIVLGENKVQRIPPGYLIVNPSSSTFDFSSWDLR